MTDYQEGLMVFIIVWVVMYVGAMFYAYLIWPDIGSSRRKGAIVFSVLAWIPLAVLVSGFFWAESDWMAFLFFLPCFVSLIAYMWFLDNGAGKE